MLEKLNQLAEIKLQRQIAIAVLSGVALSGVEFCFFVLFQQILASVGFKIIEGSSRFQNLTHFVFSEKTPLALFAALVIVAMIRSFFTLIGNHACTRSNERLMVGLKKYALKSLQNESSSLSSPNEMHYFLGEVLPKAGHCLTLLFSTIPVLSCSIVIWAILFSFSPTGTIFATVGAGCVGLTSVALNRRVRNEAIYFPEIISNISDQVITVNKNLSYLRAVRMLANQISAIDSKLSDYRNRWEKVDLRAHTGGALTGLLGSSLLGFLLLGQFYFLKLPSAIFIGFIFLFLRLVQNLSSLANSFGHLSVSWPYVKIAMSYVSKQPDAANHPSQIHPTSTLLNDITRSAPAIEIAGIHYSYPHSSKPVLTNLSSSIPSGGFLGIVGPSGCGKSTLLSLIMGVTEPQKGTIRIAGLSPEVYFGAFIGKGALGYVGSEPYLIEGSLRDNLLFSMNIPVNDEQCMNALRLAQLLGWYGELSLGLDTRIETNGRNLSAGQRQRLCIARAIINQPQILILDEATANLDQEVEKKILDTLKRQSPPITIIMVTHRESLLSYCDSIIRLQ